VSEKDFKINELERLLSEGKITLEQYLDTRTKIENNQLSFHESEQFSSRPQNLAPQPEPPRRFQVREHRKPYRKIALGIILCLIIFTGGFFVSGYLNPVRAEALTIESHSIKFMKAALLFKLKNTGNTDIRISQVKMNNYLNQSLPGWRQGWNGTTFLQPQQTGSLYVYVACYFYILNASMPQLSSTPSQTELDNFYSWMESYNATFTIVTNTQRQYSVTVPEFTVFIFPWWMGALTFTFMKTEELKITSVTFQSNTSATIVCTNTGTDTLTVTGVTLDDASTTEVYNAAFGSDGSLAKGASGTISVTTSSAMTSGAKYTFAVLTASGNKYTYTTTAT